MIFSLSDDGVAGAGTAQSEEQVVGVRVGDQLRGRPDHLQLESLERPPTFKNSPNYFLIKIF